MKGILIDTLFLLDHRIIEHHYTSRKTKGRRKHVISKQMILCGTTNKAAILTRVQGSNYASAWEPLCVIPTE